MGSPRQLINMLQIHFALLRRTLETGIAVDSQARWLSSRADTTRMTRNWDLLETTSGEQVARSLDSQHRRVPYVRFNQKNATGIASREIVDEPPKQIRICADANRSEFRELRSFQYCVHVFPAHAIELRVVVWGIQPDDDFLHFVGDCPR